MSGGWWSLPQNPAPWTTALGVLAAALWYSGVFRSVSFRRATLGPCVFFYRTGRGPYSGVGPMFAEVEALWKQWEGRAGFGGEQDHEQDHERHVPAGIYYDDPKTTPPSDLRYAVGFLWTGGTRGASAIREELGRSEESSSSSSSSVSNKNHKTPWNRLDIPATPTVAAAFPNRLGVGSVVLSAMKTYAAFERQKEFSLQSGAVEVYWPDRIVTHFPQGNHDLFCPRDEPQAATAGKAN